MIQEWLDADETVLASINDSGVERDVQIVRVDGTSADVEWEYEGNTFMTRVDMSSLLDFWVA